jgi:hypothetical protein
LSILLGEKNNANITLLQLRINTVIEFNDIKEIKVNRNTVNITQPSEDLIWYPPDNCLNKANESIIIITSLVLPVRMLINKDSAIPNIAFKITIKAYFRTFTDDG